MKYLLKNGKIINPLSKKNDILDILIEDGIIKNIGKNLNSQDAEKIDLSGKVVAPGFIDMHVHLREPGFEYKESIETGSLAARYGGFTSVCCMPNTNPVIDTEDVIRSIQHKSQNLLNDVFIIAAVTNGNEGKEMAPLLELKEAGAVAFSDDAMPVASSEVQRRIMEYLTMFDGLFIQHCEDQSLTKGGIMNEGYTSTALGMVGIPPIAEEIMAYRGIALSEYSNSRYHIAHVSTAKTVELVRAAKKKGLKVTCEATPHHFTLTDDAVRSFDTNTKMNPPLRTAEDVKSIKEGLKDGTIDVIATDHAPHAIQEKDVEYVFAPFGIIGLETAFALAYTELVKKGYLTIENLIEKLSINPRKILHLPEIQIEVGEKANLTILDLEKNWSVDISELHSKSKNSPFHGYKLTGKAAGVVNNNKIEIF